MKKLNKKLYFKKKLFFNIFLMKIFVFDTETTWFINKKDLSLEAQPYIIQIAWIYWKIDENWNFEEIKRINEYIKPPISIPYEASQVNHIYDVDIKNAPIFEEKIQEYISMINDADYIVWHNIEYDESMTKIELKRLQKEFLYNPKNIYCTMKETVDFCQLKWNWERYKYPKLWELYKILFWEYFVWAHDAIVDVEATLKVFLELYKKWMVRKNICNTQVISLF